MGKTQKVTVELLDFSPHGEKRYQVRGTQAVPGMLDPDFGIILNQTDEEILDFARALAAITDQKLAAETGEESHAASPVLAQIHAENAIKAQKYDEMEASCSELLAQINSEIESMTKKLDEMSGRSQLSS